MPVNQSLKNFLVDMGEVEEEAARLSQNKALLSYFNQLHFDSLDLFIKAVGEVKGGRGFDPSLDPDTLGDEITEGNRHKAKLLLRQHPKLARYLEKAPSNDRFVRLCFDTPLNQSHAVDKIQQAARMASANFELLTEERLKALYTPDVLKNLRAIKTFQGLGQAGVINAVDEAIKAGEEEAVMNSPLPPLPQQASAATRVRRESAYENDEFHRKQAASSADEEIDKDLYMDMSGRKGIESSDKGPSVTPNTEMYMDMSGAQGKVPAANEEPTVCVDTAAGGYSSLSKTGRSPLTRFNQRLREELKREVGPDRHIESILAQLNTILPYETPDEALEKLGVLPAIKMLLQKGIYSDSLVTDLVSHPDLLKWVKTTPLSMIDKDSFAKQHGAMLRDKRKSMGAESAHFEPRIDAIIETLKTSKLDSEFQDALVRVARRHNGNVPDGILPALEKLSKKGFAKSNVEKVVSDLLEHPEMVEWVNGKNSLMLTQKAYNTKLETYQAPSGPGQTRL